MIKFRLAQKLFVKYGAKEKLINLYRSMCTIPEEDVLIQNAGGKGIITLNRPKALNALNLSMVKKILPTLQKWDNEKSLVIVKGAGEKSFCAGGDVKSIVEANLRGEKLGEDFFRNEYTMNGLIGAFKQPYIAIIDGITMGGGVGLSVHGKYRVATERTLFAMPETAIGLFPDVGGSYFLPKLCNKLGLYLALTGYRLKGQDVFKAGIATHYVESKDLQNLEQDLINKCSNDDDVMTKLEEYDASNNKDFSLCENIDQINHCFSADTVEGIIERLHEDNTDWAKNTTKTLSKMSPTSMKVSKKLLDISEKEKLSLQECLSLEYRVACNTLSRGEFNEGL